LFYGKEVMSTPPVPSSSQSPTDFSQALELFKQNYVQYRATGKPEYKIAYENANAYITSYLNSMQQRVANDRDVVTKFVTDYSNANPDLDVLKSRFRAIRTEGPAVQDQYTTVRRVKTEVPEVSYTDVYVKLGLVVALIGLLIVASR